jgi:predicted ATP-grasp superfamily ATP-dependent carboligase
MTPLDTRVPALLLRLDRNPFHHGSLGAVRSLGRAGVEVHAFVESARVPLAHSRYLRGAHRFAGDPRSDEDVARELLAAAERIGRPAVLLPMDDLGALAVLRLAGRLRGPYLLPAPPAGPVARAADKAELAALCAGLGVPHPPTLVPDDAAGAAAAVRELGLPAVAKWARPWLLPPGAGLRGTTVVTGEAQARRLFEAARAAGGRLVFQRLLPGGRGADWFFHGCFGAGGRCLLGGTGRKELSWPVRAGLTAVGRRLPNPAVAGIARRLAAHLGYRGVLDVDFRRDAATGRYHLLDVNPRPGAQFRLFTDEDGLDVVRALHLDLTGREVPAARRAGAGRRVFVAENHALAAAVVRAGRGTGAVWRGGDVEWAWFAADDPEPFRRMARAWLARAVRRAERPGGGAVRAVRAVRTQREEKAPCTTW